MMGILFNIPKCIDLCWEPSGRINISELLILASKRYSRKLWDMPILDLKSFAGWETSLILLLLVFKLMEDVNSSYGTLMTYPGK